MMAEKMMSAADLWQKYTKKPDPATREKLIMEYLPLVKYVVGRMSVTLPPTVDSDDLMGYGVMGLIAAIERFSPERGFKFETFAVSRIRGAIIDELRSQDWLPRSVRQKAKEMEANIRSLEHQLGRTATDQELADSLGVDVAPTSTNSILQVRADGTAEASATLPIPLPLDGDYHVSILRSRTDDTVIACGSLDVER